VAISSLRASHGDIPHKAAGPLTSRLFDYRGGTGTKQTNAILLQPQNKFGLFLARASLNSHPADHLSSSLFNCLNLSKPDLIHINGPVSSLTMSCRGHPKLCFSSFLRWFRLPPSAEHTNSGHPVSLRELLSDFLSANFGRTKMEARSHDTIQRDPNYQELVRRRSSLGWTLSLIMLVIYFGFILLVAYAPKFLGMRFGEGVTTIGIPIGLFVIASAFVLTGIYVSKANSKYDALIRRIVER
jgi:uncharacterized membrane protein (DUF485 family)